MLKKWLVTLLLAAITVALSFIGIDVEIRPIPKPPPKADTAQVELLGLEYGFHRPLPVTLQLGDLRIEDPEVGQTWRVSADARIAAWGQRRTLATDEEHALRLVDGDDVLQRLWDHGADGPMAHQASVTELLREDMQNHRIRLDDGETLVLMEIGACDPGEHCFDLQDVVLRISPVP